MPIFDPNQILENYARDNQHLREQVARLLALLERVFQAIEDTAGLGGIFKPLYDEWQKEKRK